MHLKTSSNGRSQFGHVTLSLLPLLLVVALFSSSTILHVDAAPVAQQQQPSLESLRTIIVELENVIYRLKDYARLMRASNSASVGGAEVDADERQLAASKAQQPAQQQLPAAGAADLKPRVPVSQQQQQPSNGDAGDISLKEALEYLVSLAKQKKMERRDHDIPFPLMEETERSRYTDRENE